MSEDHWNNDTLASEAGVKTLTASLLLAAQNGRDSAEQALAPFAIYAAQVLDKLEHYTPDSRTHLCINDHRITYGDLRRAVAVSAGIAA